MRHLLDTKTLARDSPDSYDRRASRVLEPFPLEWKRQIADS